MPTNPFLDLTGARPTSTISVVIFAAFIGIAFIGVKRKYPEQAELFKKMLDAVYAIVMRMVTLILRLTPYGVLALMAKTVAGSDINAILKLGNFCVSVLRSTYRNVRYPLIINCSIWFKSNSIFEKGVPCINICIHISL